MTASEYQEQSTASKIKNKLFGKGHENETEGGGDRADPVAVHEQVKSARAKHEQMEAEADANIQQRESTETFPPPSQFVPPIITNPREPLHDPNGSLSSPSTAGGRDGAAGEAGLPDLTGGTHIPENQLHARHHESQRTALRPSRPGDVTAMDGEPEHSTAGDDLAI